ncbi:aldo/keto reductase [bacterium]|nr:aldo/keto reductase [bacterium]
MSDISRRSFLNRSLAGASAILASPAICQAAESKPKASRSAFDRVELGKTGIKVSRLAQGTGMRGSARSSEHTRMGQEKCSQILRHGFEKGLNFYDMADLYGTHPFVRNALKELPRDEYVMLSKLWFREADWNKPSGGAIEEVHRYCKELGTDYLDVCLIHCITNDRWTEELTHVREDMEKLKEKGVIRAKGVSCHDLGGLKIAASDPWTEVIFARINHKGGRQYKMDGTVEEVTEVIKTARANGKAVVGMKIFGEGTLVKPEEKDASMKYVAGNDLVDAMTVGMTEVAQVDDTSERLTRALNA